VDFGNPLIWALAAFGHSFMTVLVAFGKISRNYKLISKEQLQKIFKYLSNYKAKNVKKHGRSYKESTDLII
jgi:hypothetical protein